MQSNIEKIGQNQVKLSVEVGEDRVEEALDQAYRKVVKKVEIPGFRKGKAPRKLLESKYGPEVLYEDALEILVPRAYQEAVEEQELEPADQPEFDIEQIEKGSPLKFSATVEVKPEVELGEYQGLSAERERVEVIEEEVEKELSQMQEKHAEYENITEGNAKNGDRLVIDFIGYIDGEAFEGGTAENQNLELGSGQMIPGFEEQLIGVGPGEEREVKVTFPEDYQKEELKGKEAVFSVTVKEIKQKNLLPLDDDFAKDVSDFETLEELKQDIKSKLIENKEAEADKQMEEQLVNQVVENVEVEIPDPMIDQETDQMVQEFEQNLSQQGLDLETYFKLAGTDKESMKEQFKEPAENRVKTRIVLEAITEQEEITVSEEEVDEEIEKMAEAYNQESDKIKQILEMQGQLDMLKQELATRKAIDQIKESANITEVEPKSEEEEQEEGKKEEEKQE